jgi:hypothetical protein
MALIISGSRQPIHERFNQFWKENHERHMVRCMEKIRAIEQHAFLQEELLKTIQDEQDSLERSSAACLESGSEVPLVLIDAILFNETARISAREYFANN